MILKQLENRYALCECEFSFVFDRKYRELFFVVVIVVVI